MGIKDNLRAFCDPDYENFDGYPDDSSDAASKWANAIGPELTVLLSPMSTAGLVSTSVSSTFISSLSSDIFDTNPGGGVPSGIDSAMDDAASTVFDAAGSQVSPSAILDSENLIFDPNFDDPDLVITPEEMCQRAEDRIVEWLMTGKFTAYYVPPGATPAGSPGITGIPWILPPGEEMPPPPDEDEDGYSDAEEIDAETDPSDPEDYPEE